MWKFIGYLLFMAVERLFPELGCLDFDDEYARIIEELDYGRD